MFNSSMKIVATLTGTLLLKGFEYIENFIKLFINFLSLCSEKSIKISFSQEFLILNIKRLHLLNSSSHSGFHRLSFHCSYSDSTSHKNTGILYSKYKMASLVKLFI